MGKPVHHVDVHSVKTENVVTPVEYAAHHHVVSQPVHAVSTGAAVVKGAVHGAALAVHGAAHGVAVHGATHGAALAVAPAHAVHGVAVHGGAAHGVAVHGVGVHGVAQGVAVHDGAVHHAGNLVQFASHPGVANIKIEKQPTPLVAPVAKIEDPKN